MKEMEGYVDWTCLVVLSVYCSIDREELALLAYFANSIAASVVCAESSFFTSRIFRGGEGHRRERRSLPFVSASVSGSSSLDTVQTDRDSWDMCDLEGLQFV